MKMMAHKGIAVQAGGNCGVYASQYAEEFKSVYTFEPEHVNFHCLTHNLRQHKNTYKFQAFLGTGVEKTSGITNPADQQSEANSGMFERTTATGDIAVLSIDNLGLTGCDLIHLDIEGGEYDALQGAEETIQQFRPLICLEWFQNREELSRLMDSLNYKEVGMAGGSDKMFVYRN
jgi:FkbM family methyltransferase